MVRVKRQLLDRIQRGYGQLMAALEELSPQQFEQQPAAGEWSARDHLAHIAQWEMVLLRFHLRGEDFSEVVGMADVRYRETPFDVINQQLYEKQREQTAKEIKQYAQQTHGQLMEALESLPAEALEAPAANLAGQGYTAEPLRHYIEAITVEHYDDHLQSLRPRTEID